MRLDAQKVSLLEAITCCITSANRKMSYRHARLLVDELNRAFRLPVIDATFGGRNGGGTKLTEIGRAIVELYVSLRREAEAAIAGELAELDALAAGAMRLPQMGRRVWRLDAIYDYYITSE